MEGNCECGCGQVTPVAPQSDKRHGYIKGQPIRFIKGHNIRGSGAAWWKGDEASYRALHTYVSKHFPKSGTCDECGQGKRTEYALIHGRRYSRNREDYRELCKLCHNKYDHVADRGPAPLCKCGCGQPVTWYQARHRWHVYVTGHYDLAAENRRRPSARRSP